MITIRDKTTADGQATPLVTTNATGLGPSLTSRSSAERPVALVAVGVDGDPLDELIEVEVRTVEVVEPPSCSEGIDVGS